MKKASKIYSIYVNLMKIILPIGIVLAIGLTFGWPYLMSATQESVALSGVGHVEIRENRMVRPHYVSTDTKGQPFELSADWAKQKTDNFADLENPKGSLTSEKGETFNIASKKGHYDSKEKILILKEAVVLTSTNNYLIKTEEARVGIKDKIIVTDTLLEGWGPPGQIRGENGGTIEDRNGKKILTLKGRSRVVMYQNKKPLKKKKESHE